MTPEQELQIRKYLAEQISTIPELGRVIPAPIYYNDKEDFWATDDLQTQDAIELSHVAVCYIYPAGFSDDEPSHSPVVTWTYEIYIFSQGVLDREDESITPDAFESKLLKFHNDFIAGILKVKGMFQGEIAIPGLTGFTTLETWPITLRGGAILNSAGCTFIPNIKGHSVTLGLDIKYQLEEC